MPIDPSIANVRTAVIVCLLPAACATPYVVPLETALKAILQRVTNHKGQSPCTIQWRWWFESLRFRCWMLLYVIACVASVAVGAYNHAARL